jgi:NAD(P)H-dependent FMN reductase
VFVTPEYNFGPPPSLLNALNYLYLEWNYKPAGIVSYGRRFRRSSLAQMLKLTLRRLKMMPLPEGVGVPSFNQFLGPGRTFPAQRLVAARVPTMLNELRAGRMP